MSRFLSGFFCNAVMLLELMKYVLPYVFKVNSKIWIFHVHLNVSYPWPLDIDHPHVSSVQGAQELMLLYPYYITMKS